MWATIFEFLPHGRYLQLSSVSTGWRALYASTMQRRGRPAQTQKVTAAVAMVASVPLIQWAVANGCKETTTTMLFYATMYGPLEVVQYLHASIVQRGIDPSHNTRMCNVAAERGHLEMLQWVRAQGFLWGTHTCAAAARGGHLEVLRWLHDAGCDWDVNTCDGAAAGGHLDVLQYARSHGCPWCYSTSRTAAHHGQLPLLQWAHANGCPWSVNMHFTAVRAGHLHMLQWLRDIGESMDPLACSLAAQQGRLDILQCLRAHGCPWNGEGTLELLTRTEYKVGDPHVNKVMSTVEWALANGCPCSDASRSRYAQLQHMV